MIERGVRAHGKEAGRGFVGRDEVGAPIAVGVEQRDARSRQAGETGRPVHCPGGLEAAVAGVAPEAHGAVRLEEVGKPVAGEVDQFERRIGQRRAWQVASGERGERTATRLEPGVVEFDRRQLADGDTGVVESDHLHLAEQRESVERQPVGEIAEIGARGRDRRVGRRAPGGRCQCASTRRSTCSAVVSGSRSRCGTRRTDRAAASARCRRADQAHRRR